ncbi:MAG TPA: LLM class F420-dependent oxidoreductase [Acidimicrobiia bacterium]|nr:LLM class F420-dependent oxidoreductase [Acidimicrobiia bacterium]
MKIETGLPVGRDPETIGTAAQELERQGWDSLVTAETSHDPFFPVLLAAERTERVELGTGIAVAFARNPMTLANIGYDLQLYSKGRFVLGLGSQIKAHIEKRFSMPWSHPAARMRELILAMRAIWSSWNDGEKLDFRGEFYRHTLMTPFFDPGPNPYGNPKIHLAAVGERMTEVAGEVADGMILHGFTTERYVREVTVPALERGFARGGRDRASFEIGGPLFVVTGTTEEEVAAAKQGTKQQIAFYGSTPAYRGVLELHGWGELQTELNSLSKQGEWVKMGELIDDEMLNTFAVVGEPEDVPRLMLARYGDLVDRLSFYAPYRSDPERWSGVLDGFRAARKVPSAHAAIDAAARSGSSSGPK